jgi:hypothetical protein
MEDLRPPLFPRAWGATSVVDGGRVMVAGERLTRRVLVIGATLLMMAAAPGLALGATVSHNDPDGLDYASAYAEINHVTVTTGMMPTGRGAAILFEDLATTASGPAPLLPATPDCVQGSDAQKVLCPANGVTKLEPNLGPLNDWLKNTTRLAVLGSGGEGGDLLESGAGDDRLKGAGGEDYLDGHDGSDELDGGADADVVVSRDGEYDGPVSCGRGVDLAIVDPIDSVVRRGSDRCELVDDEEETPRPGLVYVHPRHCGEEGAQVQAPAMHRLVPLRYDILLPSGFKGRRPPIVDPASCWVRLRAAGGQDGAASADVTGTAFTLRQSSKRMAATTLTLIPPSCGGEHGRSASAYPSAQRVRLATRRRPGRWRVKGKYSIAASDGTDWTTVEACSSTTTIVRRGRVEVYDRIKRRTVTVDAGRRYVAPRPATDGRTEHATARLRLDNRSNSRRSAPYIWESAFL